MTERVAVVGPLGERGTVDASELGSMTAGWRLASEADAHGSGGQFETPLGEGYSALLGAGRSATLGGTDIALKRYADLFGGEEAKKEQLRYINQARTENPGATTAGEFGGLLAGGGVLGAGEHAGAYVAERAGQGLLGRMASMVARSGVEGAGIGVQQAITEDTLGDHELNGQAIFSEAAKNGLIGAAVGVPFGAGEYFWGKGVGLLAKKPGPLSAADADAIAGAEGAGKPLLEDLKARQAATDAARNAGMTADQAVAATDAASNAGPLGKIVAAMHSGGDAEAQRALEEAGAKGKEILEHQTERLNKKAMDMAEAGTRAMRSLENVANEAQFTMKPQNMAKLVDASLVDAQRDATAGMFQDIGQRLEFLNGLSSKGGSEGAVSKIGKVLKDKSAIAFDESAPAAKRFIALDEMKRAIGHQIPWNRVRPGGTETAAGLYGLTEAQVEFVGMYNRLRSGLEDDAVWGAAGRAQKDLNEVFTAALPRREDFGRRFTVGIDRTSGAVIPEVDPGKLLQILRSPPTDAASKVARDSMRGFIDGIRARADAAERLLDLTPAQRASFAEGRNAVSAFEGHLNEAEKHAAVLDTLEKLHGKEAGSHGGHIGATIGGIVGGFAGGPVGAGVGSTLGGLVGHVTSKPVETMMKLGDIRRTLRSIGGKVSEAFGGAKKASAGALSGRERAKAVEEMTRIRELAGNPQELESRLGKMTGDLGSMAPKTARSVQDTARRAVVHLAQAVPPATIQTGLFGVLNQKPRWSDQQISQWESKRRGTLGAPESDSVASTMLSDMKDGKLNREAIQSMEAVSPALFSHMQELVRDELMRMQQSGTLDKMSYQDKAAIASLLKMAPDPTWTPQFIATIQATKQAPPPPTIMQGDPGVGSGRKPAKVTADQFMTEADKIEKGT